MRITGDDFHDAVHYPLALIVKPGRRLDLRLKHDAERLDGDTVRALGDRLARVLEAIADDPDRAAASVELLSARRGRCAPIPPARSACVPETHPRRGVRRPGGPDPGRDGRRLRGRAR